MNPITSAPTSNPAVHDVSRAPDTGHTPMPAWPPGLCCQLTRAPLEDAVLAEDGYSYNRPAWEAHVRAHPHVLLSPVTHQLVSPTVIPNRHLKNIVAEWHAAQPTHARPFDMEGWVEDFVTKEVMREPVVLPDGMVCDKETARLHIFKHPQHPGRSMLDQRVTFNPQQKMLRDLGVLMLSEEVLGHAPGTLSRYYVLPSIAAMLLPRSAPGAAPAAGNAAPVAAQGAPAQAAPGAAALAIQAANAPQPAVRCARAAMAAGTGALLGCVMLAPLAVAIAAEAGAFEADLTFKQSQSLAIFAFFATVPWAAAVLSIMRSMGCFGRPRPRAAAPVVANAV